MSELRREIADALGLVECDQWERFNSQSLMKGCNHEDGKCYPKQYGPPKVDSVIDVFFRQFDRWRATMVWCRVEFTSERDSEDNGWFCDLRAQPKKTIESLTRKISHEKTLPMAGCKAWLAALKERNRG